MSDSSEPNLPALFLMGVLGIIATGVLLGIGGENYWHLLWIGPLGPQHYVSPRTVAFLVAVLFAVGIFDLIALGMMFAGGVIIIQRLRGRI